MRDDGPGIEPEPARRIFEKLYQVKSADGGNPSKGLGLGLFIAREIVTRQGGTLAFDSVPGKGSTFYFSLPLFELEPFLAPFFDSESPGTLHLLRVRVFPPRHALNGAAARVVLLECRSILQHHLHAADRMLPETAPDGAEGDLFIVSASPAPIAEKAARRLEQLLRAQHIIKINWLEPVVDPMPVDYDAKAPVPLASAAKAVEAAIKRMVSERLSDADAR
ncbi:MAG: hypothetical protein AUJ52_11320 [Elusimicrobia bacterium CG1_02_63_36]|nr:MAG: hypothetical protein AUJ52_11320 [Elusimicrobia bacterium CG1_02_63_36]